ncbi:MAG: DUF342 domain-containing protein [Cellulosilyticaceae bacterium]
MEITPDKMMCVVSFEELEDNEDERLLTDGEIKKAITAAGVTTGIDSDVLDVILTNRKYDYKYVLAKGTPAIAGKEATILFKFDKDNINKCAPKHNEDGTVNFKDLSIIKNVTKETVLAIKMPAEDGVAGINVTGQEVRASRGRDVRMPRGKNTKILDDGVTLVAEIDGQLCYDEHNVYITPSFIVEKDVDISTGNIDFIGNVIVNGSVQAGFKITAGGTVEVKGSVEAADIYAEGDIIVWYGIQGMDKGIISTRGNVIAKFIQNVTVEAGGSVVAEAIMHSNVSAIEVDVTKGKGLLVGGEVVVAKKLKATIIGSHMATVTTIKLGLSPKMLKEFKEIEESLDKMKEDLNKISQSITFLMNRKDMLGQEKQELLRRLLNAKMDTELKIKNKKTAYDDISEKVECSTKGIIKIKKVIYSGAKIIAGSSIKYVSEDHNNCSIKKRDGDIVFLAY